MEIDEYSDYEKAQAALREALIQLQKANGRGDVDKEISRMEKRIEMLEKFIQARRVADTDPNTMVRYYDFGLSGMTNSKIYS